MTQPGQFAPRNEDWVVRELQALRGDLQRLAAANPFTTMGITPKTGGIDVAGFINSLRADGTVSLAMDDSGAFVVYDGAGSEVARFGDLVNSNPGQYGVEIRYNGAWVQVGSGNVDWPNISNKPASFTAAPHTHPGGDVTSRVGSATDAIGSQSGWTNTVMGTQFYAVWVGNDGSFSFGRNTSALKYKDNLRQLDSNDSVLDVYEYLFDRKAQYRYPEDENGVRVEGPAEMIPGAVNEYGTIADYAATGCPELTTYFEGAIDGFKYEMVGLRLIPVVRRQRDRIAALEVQNTTQAADIAALKQAVRDLGGNI